MLAGVLIPVLLLASPEEAAEKLKVAYASLYEWKESGVENAVIDFTYSKRWITLDSEGIHFTGRGQVLVVGDEIVRRHYPATTQQQRDEIDAHVLWVLERFVRKPFDERFKDVKSWKLETLEDGTHRVRAGGLVYLLKGDRLRGMEINAGTAQAPLAAVVELKPVDLGGGYTVAGQSLAYRLGDDRFERSRELTIETAGDHPVPRSYLQREAKITFPAKGDPASRATEIRIEFTGTSVNLPEPVVVDPKAKAALEAAWKRRYVLPDAIRIECAFDRKIDKALRLRDWTSNVKGDFQIWGMDQRSLVVDPDGFRQDWRLEQTEGSCRRHFDWFFDFLHDRPFDKEFAGCGFAFAETADGSPQVNVFGCAKALGFRLADGAIAGYLPNAPGETHWWTFKRKENKEGRERLEGMSTEIDGQGHTLRFRYGRAKGIDIPRSFEALEQATWGPGPPVWGVCTYTLKRTKVSLPGS